MESNGLQVDEYGRDLFAEDILALDEDDDGKRNILDVAELVTWFAGSHSDMELVSRFPDLISKDVDVSAAIQMYRRFAGEANAVFAVYAGVQACLQ